MKFEKVTFIRTKKYMIQKTLMLVKYQSLKKNDMVQRIHLNTLSGMMIVMLVDHYVKNFQKWHARKYDENRNMSFRINNKQLLNNYDKMW